MTLRSRITLGLISIAVILLIPLLYALSRIEDLHNATRALRDREFAASLLLGSVRELTDDVSRSEDALLFLHDTASSARLEGQLQRMDALADSIRGFDLVSTADSVKASVQQVRNWAAQEFAAASSGRAAAGESISKTKTRPAIAAMKSAVVAGESALRKRTVIRVEGAAQAADDAQRIGIIALIIALLIATILAIWLARSISRPIYELDRGMQAVAEGDFSVTLPTASRRKDEFGRLSASYESMAMQLAELDRVKAEFVSIASHELKTPINVIIGYLELLQENVYGEMTPKQREICDTLMKQAQSLTRLVKRLLDISRFEASGGKLDLRDVDFPRFLNHLESSFHVLAHQRGIEFHVHHDENLPQTVRCDEDRVNEVLGNLLSNAFKFTNRGGVVDLTVSRSDDSVCISVKDTGVGIDPQQLPRVFQKFYQADNQAQTSAKGTGLGLAIAKEIVEAHGGDITVTSALGKGTEFALELPIQASFHRRTSKY